MGGGHEWEMARSLPREDWLSDREWRSLGVGDNGRNESAKRPGLSFVAFS
jgi:hypothetical protein